MALQAAISVTANGGETIDALVWRVLGRAAGAVEKVLEANPGLAAIGEVLPEGTQVVIPAAADVAGQAAVPMVHLWD